MESNQNEKLFYYHFVLIIFIPLIHQNPTRNWKKHKKALMITAGIVAPLPLLSHHNHHHHQRIVGWWSTVQSFCINFLWRFYLISMHSQSSYALSQYLIFPTDFIWKSWFFFLTSFLGPWDARHQDEELRRPNRWLGTFSHEALIILCQVPTEEAGALHLFCESIWCCKEVGYLEHLWHCTYFDRSYWLLQMKN